MTTITHTKCKIPNCENKGNLKSGSKTERRFKMGFCAAHYDKWYVYGDPLFVKRGYSDNLGKLLTKIIFDEDYVHGCWDWADYKNDSGYGQFRMVSEEYMSAHRASYIIFVDDNIKGLDIDHLCRNPACTNPNHLEAVTSKENTLRGISPPAMNNKKTHCKYGHEFTKENTWGKKSRICRLCSNRRWREWYHKKKRTI